MTKRRQTVQRDRDNQPECLKETLWGETRQNMNVSGLLVRPCPKHRHYPVHPRAEINKAAFNESVCLPPKAIWGGAASAVQGTGTPLALKVGVVGEYRGIQTAGHPFLAWPPCSL